MWEYPQHGVSDRDRPVSLRSVETGAERGSSRSGLREPEQLPGTQARILQGWASEESPDVVITDFCWY